MTIINPKSIAGVTSITTPSGSDNLFTVHTNNTTERVRINNDGDVIVGSGITVSPDGDIFATGVCTATTFSGAISGTTGTFSDDVTVTGSNKKFISNSTSSGDYVRVYAGGGTGKWDIYGNGADLRFSDNDSAGVIRFDTDVSITDKIIHTGDTNTTIRFPAADTITAETGGSERLRIDSSGNLSLGTSTSIQKFTIDGGGISLDNGWNTQWGANASRAYIQGEDANGNNRLILGTNNVERVRIDSDGNFGIGMSPSGMRLDVQSTANDVARFSGANSGSITIRNDTNHELQLHTGTSDALIFGTNGENERMRITSAGDVCINCTSANANLQVQDTSSNVPHIRIETSDGGNKRLDFKVESSNGIISSEQSAQELHLKSTSHTKFYIDGTQEFMISSTNGRLERSFGGGSGSGSDLDGMWFNNDQAASGTFIRFWQTSGSYGANQIGSISHSANNTSYNTSSDYRLKENAVAISDGITRLKTLKPYRFNFKTDANTTVDGFFAHEVTAVPEAITGTKDEVDSDNNPVYQGIDQSKLVPLLTAALQEAVAKIEVLETRLNNAGIAT